MRTTDVIWFCPVYRRKASQSALITACLPLDKPRKWQLYYTNSVWVTVSKHCRLDTLSNTQMPYEMHFLFLRIYIHLQLGVNRFPSHERWQEKKNSEETVCVFCRVWCQAQTVLFPCWLFKSMFIYLFYFIFVNNGCLIWKKLVVNHHRLVHHRVGSLICRLKH